MASGVTFLSSSSVMSFACVWLVMPCPSAHSCIRLAPAAASLSLSRLPVWSTPIQIQALGMVTPDTSRTVVELLILSVPTRDADGFRLDCVAAQCVGYQANALAEGANGLTSMLDGNCFAALLPTRRDGRQLAG